MERFTPGLSAMLATAAAPPSAGELERTELAHSLDLLEEHLEMVDQEFFKQNFDPMPAVLGVLAAGGNSAISGKTDTNSGKTAEEQRLYAYNSLKVRLSAS